MFKKLVSNLPFQPMLLTQVSVHLRRMRREESLRRIGFGLVIIVVILQLFMIISPTKPSLATSTADIIYGAASRQDTEQAYRNNRDSFGHSDIQAIYNYYGIGIDQIDNATLVTIKDNDGRSYINTSRSPTPYANTFMSIPNTPDGGIYEFPLTNWRQSEFPAGYPALTGMSSYGFRFWILYKNGGNIVFEKGAKKPSFEIAKQRLGGDTIAGGNAASYMIQFRNTGTAIANNVSITDRLASEYIYQSYTSTADLTLKQDGQLLTWSIANKNSQLAPSSNWITIKVYLKTKAVTATKQICNSASIAAESTATVSTTTNDPASCTTITVATCPGTGVVVPADGVRDCPVNCPDGSTLTYNESCTTPQLTCQSLYSISEPNWNTRKFETTLLAQRGAIAKNITYYVNNKKVSSETINPGTNSQFFTYTFPGTGNYQVRAEVTAENSNMVQTSQSCTLTTAIQNVSGPTARISTDKTVSNLTQKRDDANNTTAKAGDVLKYTLIISNTGTTAASVALTGQYGENISDILEYANLTSKGDAQFNDKTNVLSWAAVSIPAGGEVKKSFTVTIKNPIPATPTSASNPLSFDYVLYNTYGRTVTVKLDKPANKIIEQAVATLPSSGPGTGLLTGGVLLLVVGYFFYRSRLLTKELELVHHEFSTGGL